MDLNAVGMSPGKGELGHRDRYSERDGTHREDRDYGGTSQGFTSHREAWDTSFSGTFRGGLPGQHLHT